MIDKQTLEKQIESIGDYLGCNVGELKNEIIPLVEQSCVNVLKDYTEWLVDIDEDKQNPRIVAIVGLMKDGWVDEYITQKTTNRKVEIE